MGSDIIMGARDHAAHARNLLAVVVARANGEPSSLTRELLNMAADELESALTAVHTVLEGAPATLLVATKEGPARCGCGGEIVAVDRASGIEFCRACQDGVRAGDES